MDKTIIIDGQQVVFRKTAGTMMRYKRQFGRELSPDLAKIYEVMPLLAEYYQKNEDELTEEQKMAAAKIVMTMETEYMYDIAYIMAAQADPTIVDQLEWLDRFSEMNILQIFVQLLPLIQGEQRVNPKNA